MAYQYKCVAAPERAKRQRGAKTRTERVAAAMQELINAEATDGWEYVRTDLVPIEERSSFLARVHEVHRAVLIFRREDPTKRRTQGYEEHRIAASEEPRTEAAIRLHADRDDAPAPATGAGPARPPRDLG